MADNYLEKKFEEHLNAPYKQAHKRPPRPARRAMVIGGAGPIGAAIVKSLRIAGHKVTFCDTDDARGKETALGTGAYFEHVDVTDPNALKVYIDNVAVKWGDIDMVIFNARHDVCASSIADLEVAQIDKAMATGVRSVIVTANALIDMRKGKAPGQPLGRFVVVCRWGEDIVDNAVSGAIGSVVRSLVRPLASVGYTANAISMSNITCEQDVEANAVCTQIPSARAGRPDDVARMVRFLTDDNSDFVNGQVLNVDGGTH